MTKPTYDGPAADGAADRAGDRDNARQHSGITPADRRLGRRVVTDAEFPPATEADALSDRTWFANHPDARFRARVGGHGTWLVRRRGNALLRTFTPSAAPRASDKEIAPVWYAAAYPDRTIERAQRWAHEALRKGAS
jgi:hypothetical protein